MTYGISALDVGVLDVGALDRATSREDDLRGTPGPLFATGAATADASVTPAC